MDFKWDERKRAQIIEDSALDLASAYLFFDGRPVIHQPTPERRGAMENDGRDRRRFLHGHMDMARRDHPRDLNETSP